MAQQKLFTKEIDKQLFAQYPKGGDLKSQKVICKIFNPYGRGVWYIINSDPDDPDYLWAIVDLFEVEVGSVSRSELENIRIGRYGLRLERDISFDPINAEELYRGARGGKRYEDGGEILGDFHKSLVDYIKSINGVDDVIELAEFPDKYGDNKSYFTVRYNVKDKYNYERKDITVDYSRKVIFMSNMGYFPFENQGDIKKIIKGNLLEAIKNPYRVFSKGGTIGEKKSIKHIILTDSSGGVFVDTDSVDKANDAIYYVWKRQNWSDVYYDITFEDGKTVNGAIDLEPHSFHKGHEKKILTWHLNVFWNNVARSDKSYIPQSDKDFAKDLVENYKLYAKGGTIQDNLQKELLRLQRDLNSTRLRVYMEGDDSDEEKQRQLERKVKLDRFNEILSLLNENGGKKLAKGGEVGKKKMTLYKMESLSDSKSQMLTNKSGDVFVYEKGVLYDTDEFGKKTTSHRMSRIDLKILPLEEMARGGKIGFEGLAQKVAKNYTGKSVVPKYRRDYGQTYSPAEAREVGRKVAAKVYRQQQSKYSAGGFIEVVKNNGYGKVINKLYNEWNSIKTDAQNKKWAENVRNAKFGTYGTVSISEVLKNFDFDSAEISDNMKRGFKHELQLALEYKI